MNTVAPSTNPIEAKRALLAARLRRAASENAPLPLSFAQQRLWFLDQLEPNSALYNMPSLLRLSGSLNLEALQKAIDRIVDRHETLRTHFICLHESPAQAIDPTLQVKLQVLDLTSMGPKEREEKARLLIHQQVNRPFQLSSEPLLRATLLRLQPAEHLLLLTMHHIVSDGWSAGIFFRELSALYSGFARGQEVSLPPLPISYSDYTLWQRERLPVFEEQLHYWKEQLKGHPPLLELPCDHPRRICPTFHGRSEALTLPAELGGKLQELAHQLNATTFMVTLAAFKCLLYRYTGQSDIIVGSPIAGRDRVETEGLIGCFVNTLALRTKMEAATTFEEIVARVREVTLGAYAHQDLPFERLVEALHPERSLNHLPFTKTMFAIQNSVPDHLEWHELKVQFLEVESDTAKFEITLLVQETSSGLVTRIEYNTDLFEAATIQRMLKHYATLLAAVVTDPAQRLCDLPLLPADERQQLLVEWNNTTTDYPAGKCVHELFETQVERNPTAIALEFGKQSLSYKELNARANQLARHLKKLKVGPGVPVAVCMQRSVEMLVAFLAVLKAGGAYVPLDANYPAARLAFMLGDLGTPLLLTQQRLLPHVPRNAKKIVCLDADWELITRENPQNVPNVASPETIAYVIYTSGSTGQPKGVAVPHRAINRLVRNTNYIRFQAGDRIAQISNISFDAATFEIWGALLNGCQLIGISKDIALSPKDFAHELRDKRITSLFLTTALFNQLAAEVPGAFETLRNVLTGGEVADSRWMRTVLAERPPQRLVNVYGPTENTTFSTYYEVAQLGLNGSPVPIGYPVANTQCYILDPQLQPLPIGVPGQLFLGGDGLACGYWNRPELTEQAFIDDPFSPPGTERKLYRTGDLARFRADGSIEFLGRIDNQVKIRGFRVELGEIEATLAQHPGVRECVVKMCGNGSGHKRLVAYFVCCAEPAPNASELRTFLQERLPDYMVPSAFLELAALPLSPNGKIERTALPEPDKARPHLEKKYAAPRDEVESGLTEIWEKILGIHPIGIEDKFFDLGGHSLLAVKVIGQIEKQFGKKLRLATIFQAPTIEQLAAIIREEIKESSVTVNTSVVEIQSKGSQRPLFFVHGAGGGMFWGYANLARHLGTDQPVYAFKSRGLDGREELTRIEEIAAQYVNDLRAIQPHGPYHLGGYCFGGNVAYEMARQLQAQGERIGLLALMNCAPPNSRYVRVSKNLRWCVRFARNLFYWVRYSIDWTPTQRKEFLRWKWGMLKRKLANLRAHAAAECANVDPGNIVDLSSYSPEQKRLWEAHIRALLAYHPQPYVGKVHLFRSPVHSLLCSFDADYGWKDYAAGGVEITVVPGAHEKILEEPCVGRLAQELKNALPGADRVSTTTPPAANRLAVFRGMIVRATLFWLGAHGETLLAEEPALETEGWTLGMLFHNLAALSGARKPARKTSTGEPADESTPEAETQSKAESCGQPLKTLPARHPGQETQLLSLPEAACRRLQTLADEEKTTLSLALVALAKALLQRYSYGNDVSLGVPISPDLERRGDLRCAVNELILRSEGSSRLTFRELLRLLRDTDAGSQAAQSSTSASFAPIPLFEVFFNLKNSNGTPNPLEQFALGFAFVPGEKAATPPAAELKYNPAFFELGSGRRMLGHLKTLLEGIASDPDQPLSSLPLLTREERCQLLEHWNNTRRDLPIDSSYATPFEAQVARNPSAIAASFQDSQLTYAELNARANQLARHLQTLGVGPEVLVGICVERSLDLVVGLLAILKAGGAYVPLDPNYPRERLEYMLKDSRAPVLLTRTTFLAAFGVTGVKTVCLDDPHQQNLIARCSTENLPVQVSQDNLAYVIYTSGSTGQPKGVQITHRSLLNHNWAIVDAYQLRAADRILQFNPISFDISVEEIFPSWLAGATVVMRPDDAITAPAYFLEFVARERLTVLNLPTAYWNEVVEMLQSTSLPESVRLMVIGGEKASDQTFRKWTQRAPQTVCLINSYGPTEATVTATVFVPPTGTDSLCIGRPLANTQAYILDERLEPVPIGTTGQLYLGGAGLSRGYLHRDELTAEKFVKSPFATETPGERFYKTGDLARFRPDGNIEFLGRADHQVKIRGFRIELGEIEGALQAHPGIKDVAVILREDVPGRKRLVAYFVPWPAREPGVSELIGFLKRKLPSYMVPSAFVQLASMPLSPAGKVNRRALPQPGHERPELKERFVAPRTPLEEALAAIWAEVLEVSRVGIHDNFFDLGGHSLLATQVMSRVRDSLQIEIPLAKLFALPTVAELAEHLAEGSAQSQPVLPSSVVSKGRSLPLSIAQRRIWFLDQFEPEQSAYNLPTGLRLHGALDVRALERSLSELSRRHAALRAMFPTEGGQPSHLVCEPRAIALSLIDLSNIPSTEREAKTMALVAQESQRPYVMSHPMLRPVLVKCAENEHVLLLVLHEIAADRHSVRVLLKELTALYDAFSRKQSISLPAPAVAYSEVSGGVRLSPEEERRQLEYWVRQLEGVPPLLDLPADRPRPVHQSDAGARHSFGFSRELSQALKRLGAQEGCTPFMALLALFQIVLTRYTGSTDFVVGTTAPNRSQRELQAVIARLTNFIALRGDLSGDPTFLELLGRARTLVLGAQANCGIAFGKVLEELKPERNASYTPVFQVLFVLDETPLPVVRAGEVEFAPFEIDNQTAKFDLTLHVSEGDAFAAWFEYSTALFDAARIARMSEHLLTLAEAALRNPTERISAMPMLPSQEVNCLLKEWNDTARDYPTDQTLIGLFEAQAARTPDAEALVSGHTRLTYRQLQARAGQIAARLKAEGVGRHSLVGICLERSWEMVAGILGTLRAGAAYVPMDPLYPKDRLAFMMEDARVQLLLTQRKLGTLLPAGQARVLCVEDLDWTPGAGAAPEAGDLPDATSQDLAYVIYTSGSTGKPKGVAIEHRSAVTFVHWAREVFNDDQLAGVLAATSICFDLSIFEIFVPLSWGGTVILAENALALPALPAANEVVLVNTVPSAIRELLRIKGLPPSVLTVNLAGEPLATALVDQIYAESAVTKVYDLYGPTETTTYSTFTLRQAGQPPTIGKPLANEQVLLLDSRRQLVPLGVPGELHIGGAGLAREYLNQPELTAEKFVSHPFEPGQRLYRTGDLARWRPDGNLEYLGRLDHQVKVRGYRIELGEIEAVLKKQPTVREVVVIVREDQPGNKRLVAYLALQRGKSPAVEELRAALKQHLPDYMMPSAFVFLDALPLTPNGKIDRKALPLPEQDRTATGVEFIPPETPTQKQLAAIWSEVLGCEQVGLNDNFFELGGHSLLAIQVISRVRQVFKVELPLFSLFDAPTIQALARGFESGQWTQNQLPVLPLQPAPENSELPVSFVQERLWFIDQLEPNSCDYNVPMALRLKGPLDQAALQRAIQQIVDRHAALRTTFQYTDGKLRQAIALRLELPLDLADLTATPPEQRLKAAHERVKAEAQKPFDLDRGPLVRTCLVRLDETDHILAVVMHHSISDGWSLAIFFHELGLLYEARGKKPPVLPNVPISYTDYAYWQRQWMQGPVLERELGYWKEKLADAPPAIELPQDAEAANAAAKGGSLAIELSPELSGGLSRLAQNKGATPYMVLMAGLAIALHKWTGQKDLVIGTVVAGRNRREVENLIGCFMNFLPIRTRIEGSETAEELLSRVRATVLEGQNHQECPFEKMVEAINPERHLKRNPLYNVGLLLQNFPSEPFHSSDLRASTMDLALDSALLDLRFEAEHVGQGLSLRCEYRTDLFHRATIQQLLDFYRRVLESVTQKPSMRLSELELTGALATQAANARQPKQQMALAISSTFTAEPIEEPLRFWANELGFTAQFEFAPFNQVFQQLLDPSSVLSTNQKGLNVLLLRLEDWRNSTTSSGDDAMLKARESVERTCNEFVAALKEAAAKNSTPYLVCLCPCSPALLKDPEWKSFLKQIELQLAAQLENATGIYLVPTRELAELYPVTDYHDPESEELGHVPYTPLFFSALGTLVARKWHALHRAAYKVIVLDCDQTLWSGVCGEDGPKGIGLEKPRRTLQQFMRAQQDAGMLLCLCSKNNEEDVVEVFEQRLDMPLRREHFAAWRLNWNPKSQNLRSLAEELNLGLDSFIFLDDNPVECAEVRSNCPEVLTLQLPEACEQIPSFLQHCWAFDHLKLTVEDLKRPEMYRRQRQRDELRAQSFNLEEFIEGLDLKVKIEPMSPAQVPRVAQLTQRTNQFNFTTRRRSEAEVLALAGQAEVLTVSVSDRFGDYGLVGVMVHDSTSQVLNADTFLLSCRVLGRGVEHQMVAKLGEIAKARKLEWVDLHFHRSSKNKPAFDFLDQIGRAYGQASNGGYLFRLPAEFAARITFNPDASLAKQPDEAANESEQRPSSAAPWRPKFGACQKIALNLCDPQKIQQAIESGNLSRVHRRSISIAPRNDVERQLCELWQKVLRLERVGVQDNFFELGGHSLLAVRLFAQLEKATGRKLPLVTLFQSPTIEQLARVLSEGPASQRSGSLVVPIQPHGSKPPLFLVHGAGGDVLWGYANLAARMPDQPIYGIKSRGQAGLEEFRTLTEMAACYVNEIKALQPRGPYQLGGYCFGGNVAYEMARQLRAEGETVGLLALLDATPSNAGYETIPWWRPSYSARFVRNLYYWFEDFRELSSQQKRRFFGRKFRALARKVIGWLDRSGSAEVDLEDVIDVNHFPENELKLWQIHLQALVTHVEQPYAGEVFLFRTSGQALFCSLEPDLCWGRLAGGVTVKEIPGSHENIFVEPNVQWLADELTRCLAAAATPEQSEHNTSNPQLALSDGKTESGKET